MLRADLISSAFDSYRFVVQIKIKTKAKNATKIKFKKEPTTNNNPKLKIAVDLNKPYNINGIPKPNTKLSVNEIEIPRYCPIKIFFLLIGWANKSSVNSLEL